MIENAITIKGLEPRTTSLKVAEVFGKEHKHVLRDIKALKIPEGFNKSNFGLIEYKDAKGEKRPMYELTKDGLTILAMGYTGKKAMGLKIKYIETFNEMEKIIKEESYEKTQLKLTAMSRTLATVRQKMLTLTEYSSISQYCDDKNIKSTFWPKSKIGKLCSKISKEKCISRKIGGGFGDTPTQYYIPIISGVFKLMGFHEKKDIELKMLYTQLCLINFVDNCREPEHGNCG